MRRKLIDQATFEKITNESVSAAEHELREVADILAQTLNEGYLSLHCFDNASVMYENLDKEYVHANYYIKDKNLYFENIEQLVVDEETKRQKSRALLGNVLESLLDDNGAKANSNFDTYMSLYEWPIKKEAMGKKSGKPEVKEKEDMPEGLKKHIAKKKKTTFKDKSDDEMDSRKEKMEPFGNKDAKNKKFDAFKKQKGIGEKKNEAYLNLAGDIVDYIRFIEYGPVFAESIAKRDERGNVVALRVPNSMTRNENKIMSYNWNVLNKEIKSLREQAKHLKESADFCKTIVKLKQQNNFSNPEGLEEVLENVVTTWPVILYLTKDELSAQISEALEAMNAKNYDDQTCVFISEGILRTAHNIYKDRVSRIMHLANAGPMENVDPFDYFSQVTEVFFNNVDQKFGIEKKIFKDLYEAFYQIYETADRRGNEALKHNVVEYLQDFAAILDNKIDVDLKLAEEAANWLYRYVETNLESSPWNVSNDTHVTVTGDHPEMGKKASHSYAPSKDFSGDWGSELPALDDEGGKYKPGGAKKMGGDSWGQEGGNEIFPSLSNPYVPKAGNWSMPKDTGVDKDWSQGHGSWQSDDVWPSLQNPYVPKSTVPHMNHGKEQDLVVKK